MHGSIACICLFPFRFLFLFLFPFFSFFCAFTLTRSKYPVNQQSCSLLSLNPFSFELVRKLRLTSKACTITRLKMQATCDMTGTDSNRRNQDRVSAYGIFLGERSSVALPPSVKQGHVQPSPECCVTVIHRSSCSPLPQSIASSYLNTLYRIWNMKMDGRRALKPPIQSCCFGWHPFEKAETEMHYYCTALCKWRLVQRRHAHARVLPAPPPTPRVCNCGFPISCYQLITHHDSSSSSSSPIMILLIIIDIV